MVAARSKKNLKMELACRLPDQTHNHPRRNTRVQRPATSARDLTSSVKRQRPGPPSPARATHIPFLRQHISFVNKYLSFHFCAHRYQSPAPIVTKDSSPIDAAALRRRRPPARSCASSPVRETKLDSSKKVGCYAGISFCYDVRRRTAAILLSHFLQERVTHASG